jgi:hypothetical protein
MSFEHDKSNAGPITVAASMTIERNRERKQNRRADMGGLQP